MADVSAVGSAVHEYTQLHSQRAAACVRRKPCELKVRGPRGLWGCAALLASETLGRIPL